MTLPSALPLLSCLVLSLAVVEPAFAGRLHPDLAAYYVLACADDRGEIVERSNGNNCRASTTRVTITP